MNNNNHIKSKILEFKDILLISKKYWIIYLLFITLTCLSTVSKNNFTHPKFEVLTFIFVSILGIFCIVYYFQHNSKKELHKTAFVIILCFGITCSLIVPICDVSDEIEHLTRAEITSQGILTPHWTGEDKGLNSAVYITNTGQKIFYSNVGYNTIQSIQFFDENREVTIFKTKEDTQKINKTQYTYWLGAFEQNPFYGYLPQAFGILIAKLLDLNVIWMLWLARICNLICYASLVSLAIKKTPHLKIQLLTVACIPITIYQASSASIDSLFFSLGILIVSHFIYMCKTKNLKNKEIIVFTILCLLFGLCKLPNLAFIFLILFVPKENFKENQKLMFYMVLSIIIVSIIGLLWSNHATPTLLHSWRAGQDSNSTQQINFLIHNPQIIPKITIQMFTRDLLYLLNGFFNFFNATPDKIHYNDHYNLITTLLLLFLGFVLLAYPKNVKFNLKTRLGSLGLIFFIYIGTCFVQLLIWTNVGGTNLGTCIKYFIPLLTLIPIASPINIFNNKNRNFDKYTITLIIGFMATLILAFATKYY